MNTASTTPAVTPYLAAVTAQLRQGLQALQSGDTPPLPPLADPPATSPLAQLQRTFTLTPYERDLLMLTLGATLDPSIAQLCNEITGQTHRCPTFTLGQALFAHADWGIINPAHPLRAWQLLELAPDFSLAHAALRLDERILCYLLGQASQDPHLQGRIDLREPQPSLPLPPSQQQLVQEMVTAWERAAAPLPRLQLTGPDPSTHPLLVAELAIELGLRVGQLAAVSLPSSEQDLAQLRTYWEREARLQSALLLVSAETLPTAQPERLAQIAHWLESLTTPVVISTTEPVLPWQNAVLSFEVGHPSFSEKRQQWRNALGEASPALETTIDQLAMQFNLNAAAVQAATAQVQPLPPEHQPQALQTFCRTHARPQLDALAERIIPRATWDDLVLPQPQQVVLLEVAQQLLHQTEVYHQWGMGRLGKGLGLSTLFHGPSGTGKSMAAEVLAGAFGLDLYRVDLSAVVSKYIGETEKNLRRIFDAASIGGVVLLFDEADALFGKRTAVRDSRDRHANQEVSYLLQRMEAYPGLAILTTNFYSALDEAFLRRLRFTVKFPYPDAPQREEIWRRVFPPQTPTHNLRYDCLGLLDLTGGNIRNIALNAAFGAAAARNPITMHHIHHAAKQEYTKLGRQLLRQEMVGWFGEVGVISNK
ncbi:MAG: ATP-binding protein [Cyanobacteria bacterium P01_G01_bin.54]